MDRKGGGNVFVGKAGHKVPGPSFDDVRSVGRLVGRSPCYPKRE